VYVDIREGCDNLIFGGQFCALLELKVSNGARQGKVAIDTAKVNETTGGGNSVLLGWIKKKEGIPGQLARRDTS
jgi:hypothetical protein